MCISEVILFSSIALQVLVLLKGGQGEDDEAASAIKIAGKFATILVWLLYEFVILCLQLNFLLTSPHAQYLVHVVTYANDATDFIWLSTAYRNAALESTMSVVGALSNMSIMIQYRAMRALSGTFLASPSLPSVLTLWMQLLLVSALGLA